MATINKNPVDIERGIFDYIGAGSPATVLAAAAVGSTYRQIDGGAGSMTWQKTTAGWEQLQSTGWSQAAADLLYAILAASNTMTNSVPFIFNGTTSNWLLWSTAGVAPPTLTAARSVGTKLILYPAFVASSQADYAIGIDSSVMWFGLPSASEQFKWYGGLTVLGVLGSMGLSLFGGLILAGSGNLPAAVNSGLLYLAAGYASPVIGRIFVGDGTGWELRFAKRIGGITTDLVTITDSGNITAIGFFNGAANKGVLIGNSYFGQQGSGYGEVGYNNNDGTGNSNYKVTDYASRIRFNVGGFSFQTAPSGTAGGAITWTEKGLLELGGRFTVTAAINAGGQLRATGWWISGDSTGLGAELGISGGAAFLYCYNRTSNQYADMNIGGVAINFAPRSAGGGGGSNTVYIDDGSNTKRQVACIIVSSAAPTTETAPDGTIWIRT
jgi:hypothetical protein